jgi:hypothetical protein
MEIVGNGLIVLNHNALRNGVYQVLPSDDVIMANAIDAAMAITLPTPASAIKQNTPLIIKKIDPSSNIITISSASLIDGFPSIALATQSQSVQLYTDGLTWFVVGGDYSKGNSSQLLICTGFPMILPSSGNIGNNGALTGIANLPFAFPDCYMFFPAGAIAAGSLAGLYYVQMSAINAGTIFNNIYNGGLPIAPSIPTPFITVGPGAYAQTVGALITLLSFTLPGNSLGKNGRLEGDCYVSNYSSGNAKLVSYKISGTEFLHESQSTAGQSFLRQMPTFANNGQANSQVTSTFTNGIGGSQSYGGETRFAIDTTLDQTITISAQINAADAATGYMIVESARFITVYGA